MFVFIKLPSIRSVRMFSARYVKRKKIFIMNYVKLAMTFSSGVIVLIACWFLVRNYLDSDDPLPGLGFISHFEDGAPFKHVSYDDISHAAQESYLENDNSFTDKKIVNTEGCKIPLKFTEFATDPKESRAIGSCESCGPRAITFDKIKDKFAKAYINFGILLKYVKQGQFSHCCVQYSFPNQLRNISKKCKMFSNYEHIRLRSGSLICRCYEKYNNTIGVIYEDVFTFIKKVNLTGKRHYRNSLDPKYNVLMLGVDSMSLQRLSQLLVRTTLYFRNNMWLFFTGYNKVSGYKYTDMMTVFTGTNMSETDEKCGGRNKSDCERLFLWNKFKERGYATAYGEDDSSWQTSFSKAFTYTESLTHRYAPPNTNKNKSICSGRITSTQRLLNYILDFADTYRTMPYFGSFWIHSFTRNIDACYKSIDKTVENFFNRLFYSDAMRDTFVIFYSDSGVRRGKYREKHESHYDERLPLLYIKVPYSFQRNYAEQNKNLAYNQMMLVTPYDLYNTVVHISDLTSNANVISSSSESCAECHSLFYAVQSVRECRDVGIENNNCVCHGLYPLDVMNTQGTGSVLLAADYIAKAIRKIKTKHCWRCAPLILDSIVRVHFYYMSAKHLFYIVAFSMSPHGIKFEATVSSYATDLRIEGEPSVISEHDFGECTVYEKDRYACACQRVDNCTIN